MAARARAERLADQKPKTQLSFVHIGDNKLMAIASSLAANIW
jgi:hypothetical protein